VENRTATSDAKSDDYTDSLSEYPNYNDGKLAALKKNLLGCLNFLRLKIQ